MRDVVVVGATGTLGRAALDVLKLHPESYRVHTLVGGRRAEPLLEAGKQVGAQTLILAEDAERDVLSAGLAKKQRFGIGLTAILEAVQLPKATVIVSQAGAGALEVTLAALRAGNRVLLGTKEAVVQGGPLLLEAAGKGGGQLISIDSEHNAIFQCLGVMSHPNIENVALTASGGPFRGMTRKDLETVTPAAALKHPNWTMGQKITIDSATLMNKGLELIEARWLFDLEPSRLSVVIHPQSIVHAIVQGSDGASIMVASEPDMRVTIGTALSWPRRVRSGVANVDLAACARLDFEAPDMSTFECLAIAIEVLQAGGSHAIALSAANDVAVDRFLAGGLPFLGIAGLVKAVLDRVDMPDIQTFEDFRIVDETARTTAYELLASPKHSWT